MKADWSNLGVLAKEYFRKEDIFKVPNILCYLRIVFSTVFLVLYLVPITVAGNHLGHIYLAIAAAAVAAYTDFIDGFIARKFNQTSKLGTLVDPIADIYLQFCIALALLINLYQYPSVLVMFIVFILKEISLLVEDFGLARRKMAFKGAKWYGKIASFGFDVLMVVLLLGTPFLLDAVAANTISTSTAHYIIDSLCLFSSLLLLIAALFYFIFYLKLIHQNDKEVAEKESSNTEK